MRGLDANPGVSGTSSACGSASACSSHSSGARSSVMRPFATAAATSKQQTAGIPMRSAASIAARPRRPSFAGALANQIQA